MNDSCQKEKPSEASKVIKGGVNFELKEDNIIIRAPVDTPNTLLKFLRYFLMEQAKLHTEERKGQATPGNSTWRTGMAGLLARV